MRSRSLALLFAATCVVSAQEVPPVQTQIYVTAIDVVVDVRDPAGKLPAGLEPSDFTIVEDGVSRTVVGAQYLRRSAPATGVPAPSAEAIPGQAAPDQVPSWQVVLYFETEMSSGDSRKTIAQEMMKQADLLAAKGTVDVVLADPTPHALLQASRDGEAIRKALRQVMAVNGANQLAINRRHFVDETDATGALTAQRARVKTEDPSGTRTTYGQRPSMDLGRQNTTNPTESSFDITGAQATNVTLNTIRPYVQQEMQLITRFRTNLVGWLASYGRHSPRTLILVTDGFDVDPLQFYKAYLSDKSKDASIDEMVKVSDSVARVGQTLATAGWTTISIPGNNNAGFGTMDDASTSTVSRMSSAKQIESRARNQGLYQPREPLERIADLTGGSVLANTSKIAAAVDTLDDRILLTYEVDRRPDGKPHKLDIRTRDANLKVRTMQWAPAATPEEMAETRAIKALQTTPEGDDFPVEATVEWNAPAATKNGMMRVVAKLDRVLSFLPPGRRGDFRVTMAVQVAPGRASAVSSLLANYEVADGTFRFRAPVNVPLTTTSISLVIEELNSGLSGTATVVVP